MTTTPEDAAAMFDLPPPEAAPSTTDAAAAAAAAAAEAELAAELAAALEAGNVAADAPDSRTDSRVKVSWPARLRLPEGRTFDVEVRNVSEGGVGLASDEPIPGDTVVAFEMDVPSLHAGGAVHPVKGTIRTTYAVMQGAETICGGTWQGPPAGLELVREWIRRLWL